MKQNLRNKGNRLFSRLAAEKKKTVIAVCLIVIMVFMWVRVLGKNTPKSTKAAVMAREMTKSQANLELKRTFIELPKVEGRNDVLTRDFFAAGGWQGFTRGGNSTGVGKVSVISKNGSDEAVKRVAGKLKLEAIISGKNPRVFISDKLLSVGDKLFVRNGIDMYECEVAGIEETEVFIRCREAEITLRLTQKSIIDY